MNLKKQKEKDRRRARKLADEAWEAVNVGNLDLGEKIIRRAVAAQEDNPVLWNDQGMILVLRKKDAEAGEAFRSAISLSPSFAEPYARLAALRFRQGFLREAVALQKQAVLHAPENALYNEQLRAFRSENGEESVSMTTSKDVHSDTDPNLRPARSDGSIRMEAIDWQMVEQRLTRQGCACIPGLLRADVCAHLRSLFDHDAVFAKTVNMDRPDYGKGTYRYFRAPIPEVVFQLRSLLYPHTARIANEWQRLLGKTERYPESWNDFRDVCAKSGQTSSTPILLKYRAGGFNALHRDLRGEVYFPIQLAVVLSPNAGDDSESGFRGGEFLFEDVPEAKKGRRREVPAGLGDAILFCTRDRLVSVGGAYGLQPVKHGVATIESGERYVLGVPFHEYR
jgi:uncharacterized protein